MTEPRVVNAMIAMLNQIQELIYAGEIVIIDGSTADRDDIFNRIGVLIAVAKGDIDASVLEEKPCPNPMKRGRKPGLTLQQANQVLHLYFGRDKWSVALLASSFEVSKTTITNVLKRKGVYRHGAYRRIREKTK